MIYTLPKKWNWKTLGDIADIIGGVSYNPNDITSSGVRIIRGGNIQNGDVRKKEDDVFLPISYANEENQIHQYDTIIVSSTGSVEALAKAATCFDEMPNTQIGAFLRIIRPRETKYAMLVSMWCTSQYFRDYLINQAKGTSINNIRTDFLTNFKILVPSDTDIQNLSNLYLNVSQKIALNRTINQQLEQLARTIYNYYFLQFHTPLTPLHDTPSRPQHPNTPTLTYNPILKKNIPIGWEVKKLFDAVDVLYGFPFNSALFTEKETDTPIVRIRDIADKSTSTYTTEPISEKYKLQKGDVLIGMDGNFHMCIWGNENAYLNQRCVRLRPLAESPISSYQILFSLQPYIKAKESSIKGSTVGHLSDKDLKELYLLQPTIQETDIKEQLNTILDIAVNNQTEITTLTTYRDAFLPLLMNGQVEVKV